ncbi:MAG: ABC transporter ATP-binding protein [Chloroflexi bacterium]|nr:ABC transporter ATP-binding protein [Chloroflexota bacterium]
MTGPATGPTADSSDSRAARAAWRAAGRAEDTLLSIRGLKKYFPITGGILKRTLGQVYAVDDVSLDIRRGETFGLVGESGCGKTTLGRTVIKLVPPSAGEVVFDGVDVFTLRGEALKRMRRRMQIIFQDPVASLNPRMPVSDLIGEGLLAQADRENGWGRRSVRDQRVGDYLEAVGLRRDYARRYPHEFSGGQRQRIGIARALALEPEFIVCDEPVSALDVSIQSQIINLLVDLRTRFNLTYLFVAHNLSVIEYISDRVGVMYLGKLAELADVVELYKRPRHPYTIALLSAVPNPDPRVRKKRLVLEGDVPSPANPPSGCRFHTRCWLRTRLGNPENCATDEPAFRDIGAGHRVACHYSEQITDATVAELVPIARFATATPADDGGAGEIGAVRGGAPIAGPGGSALPAVPPTRPDVAAGGV